MDKTIAARIRHLRGNMTQRELAKELGVSPQAVSEWENGNKTPRMGVIEKISRLFGVTKGFILGEVDVMSSLEGELTQEEQLLIEGYRSLDGYGRELTKVVVQAERKRCIEQFNTENNDEISSTRLLPLYDYPASAGKGSFAGEGEYFELVPVPKEAPMSVAFGIKIKGDSMEPQIPDGSVVWVRPQSDVADGEVCIVTIDDEGYCKKKYGNIFVSINPEYEDLHPGKEQRVIISGKVLYIQKISEKKVD